MARTRFDPITLAEFRKLKTGDGVVFKYGKNCGRCTAHAAVIKGYYGGKVQVVIGTFVERAPFVEFDIGDVIETTIECIYLEYPVPDDD